MTSEIQLTRGMHALIDDEDIDIASMHWRASIRSTNRIYAASGDGRKIHVYMHRLILERKLGRALKLGEETDHINRDTLDNRRSNLRVATSSQNHMNRSKYKNGKTSRYIGVYYCESGKRLRRWRAQIKINGKMIGLGAFKTELEAANARDDAAKKLFGEYAKLNFFDGEKLETDKEKCTRCQYEWEKRKASPKCCPRCKSYKWNVKKEEEES